MLNAPRRRKGEPLRWELTVAERERLQVVADRGYSPVEFARAALHSPRLVAEAVGTILRGALSAAATNGSLVWVLDSQRSRRVAPGVASGASWANEEWFMQSLTPRLTPEMSVVDLGSGAGRIARHVAPRVDRVICAEPSGVLLEEARRNLAALANVVYLRTDGLTVAGVPDASVDLVCCQGVASYLDITVNMVLLTEVGRMLRPGALSVISWFTADSEHGADYARDVARTAIRRRRLSGSRSRPYFAAQIRGMHAVAGLEVVEVITSGGLRHDPDVFIARRPDAATRTPGGR